MRSLTLTAALSFALVIILFETCDAEDGFAPSPVEYQTVEFQTPAAPTPPAPTGMPAPIVAAPCPPSAACPEDEGGFFHRFCKAYYDAFTAKDEDSASTPAERRALPEPWHSPPFPGHEYQGYPLMGVPPETEAKSQYPLMKALQGSSLGDFLKDNKINIYGWIEAEGNFSTSNHSNIPDSYWIVPNRIELDQAIVRFEREANFVQTDHVDWGFRITNLYGIDYRYITAGGWASDQLLENNSLYGYDLTEIYGELYVPWVAQGMVIRVGRWIATPDIETQFGPDNYMGSHSLLFTYDSYTQTGVMLSFLLNDQWMVQGAIQAGTDMAPWYGGATPTGFFGLRWVSKDNNDSLYTCLNNINNAKFRYFYDDGQLRGHDNFNYIVSTWTHRFSDQVHTNTEAYYMWQFDAVVGGTPSFGPVRSFGGGGGFGAFIPGNAPAYGVLNYTELAVSKRDYITVRNEWWRDEKGERSGFATNYSSHSIGLSHQFNDLLMVRPEISYFHSYDLAAFDLGTKKDQLIVGADMILRF